MRLKPLAMQMLLADRSVRNWAGVDGTRDDVLAKNSRTHVPRASSARRCAERSAHLTKS
jgi:hypothetical protein